MRHLCLALVLVAVAVGCDLDVEVPSVPVEVTPTPTPAPRPTSQEADGERPLPRSTELGDLTGGDLPDGPDVAVERIVDGDTIVVDGGQRVRLTGIDTPETVHPQRPVECFGREASAFISQLIPPGTPVRLEMDVQSADRYGRTLAYVWRLGDAVHVNLAMVLAGYAQVHTVPPNVRHQELYLEAQRDAREQGRGLWDACSDGDG